MASVEGAVTVAAGTIPVTLRCNAGSSDIFSNKTTEKYAIHPGPGI